MLRTSPVISSATSSTSSASPATLRRGFTPASIPSLRSQEGSFASRQVSGRSSQSTSPSSLSRPSVAVSSPKEDSPLFPHRLPPRDSAGSSSQHPPTIGASLSADGVLETLTADVAAVAPLATPDELSAPTLSSAAARDHDTSSTSHKRRGSGPEEEPKPGDMVEDKGEGSANTNKKSRPAEEPPKTLPARYELCPIDDMVECIANMLTDLISTNDAIGTSSGGLTRFHSRTAPGISVRNYLGRLARHATLTPPLLLVMVYFIDRLCLLYQDFTINTLTVHRFLITAATVASKGLSDAFWNNTTYARVGGVGLEELKTLELEFLYRVDWKIIPNPDVLVAYYRGLVERTPGYVLESTGSDSEENDDGDDDEDDDDNVDEE